MDGLQGTIGLRGRSRAIRFPLHSEHPSTDEFCTFFDLDIAFLFEEPPASLLSQWIDEGLVLWPYFAIQCVDGTLFGQPYDKLSEPLVKGDFL